MERLTQREEHCPDPKEIYGVSVKDHDYIATANRLADYEDTGLTPEEINKMHTYIEAGYLKSIARIYGIGIERMKELTASDRKGRVVVLPCKVGDTVWVNGAKRTVQVTIDEIYLNNTNEITCLVSFNCEGVCDGCPFNYWHRDDEEASDCCAWGQSLITEAEFGKTIFLTREKALEAMKDG